MRNIFAEAIPEPTPEGPSPIVIILIIAGILVALGVVAFVLFKFVFSRMKMKREIKEIDHRFNYLHSLLIGQDAQYISRLENISRSNLLYVDIHTKYLKKFKEIRDKRDSKTQHAINDLKDLLDDKKYSQLKEAIANTKEILASYEKEINSLNNELVDIIKPEEDCKTAVYALKENARRVKNDYYTKQADLDLVKESFNAIFEHLDELFTQIDDFILSAQYDDAKALLPQIESILKQCADGLAEMPTLCTMVVSIVPDKINALQNAYDIMVADYYPLDYLRLPIVAKELRGKINVLTSRIKQFSLRNVKDDLDNMLARIEEYFRIFEDERKARTRFEEENDAVYRDVNSIERKFIKLCNNIPEVEKVYVINEEHKQKIDSIQLDVDKLGSLKRALDTYIHSANKQPYTLLVGKMDELKNANAKVVEDMNNFNKYLVSLKNDSQAAYDLIQNIYYKSKIAEKTIRDINIENVSNKYADKIKHIYELCNEIHDLLFASPIHVDDVNKLASELKELSDEVLSENSGVALDKNLMLMAENASLYANRSRADFVDVNQLLNQTELLFEEGEFEQAYVSAGNVLQKLHSHTSDE